MDEPSDIGTLTAAEEDPSRSARRRERKVRKRRSKYPWSETVTEVFPVHADLVDRAVAREGRRYRRYGTWHMNWFRLTGFIEIVLSVTFPFMVTFLPTVTVESSYQNLILTGISVGIALVGSVRAFYSWNENWRLYRTQRLAVEIIVRRWELALLELTLAPKPDRVRAHEETKQAIDDLNQVLEYEQDTITGSVRLPEEILKQRRSAAASATQGAGGTS
ncbi:hypothetical protein GCM10027598_70590 [Amycolatopsis oliviviridis]|uniref:DUF4231 domain-containing protein n=1 Tax=Amycolatopsis oliviviridis TaxID=1471590 RepID=A0ABQ3L2Z2_9PSEU|nr:DUF4231 domain-containing protein [Amycolatopsis oliviviridis]GHH00934.1 hypothetical protein GCM10017790_00520 [Amycolatopsis oliviviridis]